jgi:hypothetical protein
MSLQDATALQLTNFKVATQEHQLVQLDELVDEDDSSALEGTDVKVKNMYGIPDDDEKQ